MVINTTKSKKSKLFSLYGMLKKKKANLEVQLFSLKVEVIENKNSFSNKKLKM